ncbi:hypothetical protein GCM10010218_32690 [Streptomyces mashuensis]|uniref:Putative restriction endonuclease domain-containing protein n=1 Tax=Streptomyces mashuensis TaxID=33904 RepID=A0A919B404_9ACTN|nr:Uma2 family endonuclease [Streptomyces mashuensis]GHF48668.1 hypothetical protein GCM10010218_32690 [Streptomyces mashuensis]
MSALTAADSRGDRLDWDDLVRMWEETNGPQGCKVEVIEGLVTVSPPPANAHNHIANLLHRRLYRVIPDEWGIYRTQVLAVPSRRGLYVPDLVVLPEALLLESSGHYVPAAAAELVIEITSKDNAHHDRIKKAAGYARAGVPLYLLVDRWAPGRPTITLYGEPKGDVYCLLHAGKFGDPVPLPEPFGFTLETDGFPAPL